MTRSGATGMAKRTAAMALMGLGAPALATAAEPAPSAVRSPASPSGGAEFRLKPIALPANPALRLNGSRSMLQTGYGGALIDLFPFEGGKFHLSGGGKLFGRAGRPRSPESEPLRPLQAFRAGSLRPGRRSPAMLVGYGRTVEQGLALGVDAGLVMGRVGATPDRPGRLNRGRLDAIDGRGRRTPLNQLARVTALYRF
jgi:hypothetical protein